MIRKNKTYKIPFKYKTYEMPFKNQQKGEHNIVWKKKSRKLENQLAIRIYRTYFYLYKFYMILDFLILLSIIYIFILFQVFMDDQFSNNYLYIGKGQFIFVCECFC